MSGLSILIVDDCHSSRFLLKNVLIGMGLHVSVQEAKDGKEGIEAFKAGFDVIFLDIEMPVMNGFEALEIIKSRNPNQFVIVISSEATRNNVVKTLSLRGNHFLAKPFTLERIREALDNFHSRYDVDYMPANNASALKSIYE